MKKRLIIDGNEIYEIDEECMKRKEKEQKKESPKRSKHRQRKRTE